MHRIVISLCSFLFLVATTFGQDDPIVLSNPSFEDMPRNSKSPRTWYDCGFPDESPPDTQPGSFEVAKEPYDGDTYLGLVVRENDTWEMVSQRLSAPILTDKCYEFSLHICRSPVYKSFTRNDTLMKKNHNTPAKLRIWGGSGYCSKAELLAESRPIINFRWLEYNFRFEPKQTHTYIMIEAFYDTPTLFPYNGNIMVDNATPIIPVPCDVVAVNVPDEPVPQDLPTPPTPDDPIPSNGVGDVTTNDPVPPVTPKKTPILDLDRKKIQTGQTIRIDKLYFLADKTNFTENSYDVLNEIFAFMKENEDIKVEIGGHTNTIPDHDYCDRLSKSRAKSVVDYLIQKGIATERLEYKGYGKRKPIVRNSFNREAQKKNQRVEIKILSFSG